MPATSYADALLDGLDPEQRSAVLAPLGPVRILAGAGTGKTRTLSRRIAYQHHTGTMPSERVLAVTHSAKAAAELAERLAALGSPYVAARTFHGAALRQLRHFWDATGRPGAGPQVLGDNRSALRVALGRVRGTSAGAVRTEDVAALAAEVSWAHAQLLDPSRYAAAAVRAGRDTALDPALVAAAYDAYETAKVERGVLDYDDLLTACTHLLHSRADVAATIRDGYRSFLVDEYQDTDPAQQQLLDAWLGDRDTVCVVGDPGQAVFGFKGADPDLIASFDRRHPGTRTVSLVRNYRSTPQIADVANRVAAGAGAAGTPVLALLGQRPDGPAPAVVACADEDAENSAIAGAVSRWLAAGVPASEIAVLHRFNAQAAVLRQALHDAGIPVADHATAGYFTAAEVRRPLRWFAAAAEVEPDASPEVLMAEALDRAGFDESAPPVGPSQARTRWENQLALLDQTRSLSAHRYSARDAVVELGRRTEREHEAAHRVGVTVATVHQAKGLEWDAVVVARTVEGSLPAAQATSAADLLEERRLFYVALTRAREHLVVTWSRARTGGQATRPSRFLALLETAAAAAPR